MTATNPKAVYDLGLGTIGRTNARPDLYEVNAQQWAGITDAGGRYGLAVLRNDKYGWDKPDDNTLRLTLIRTPESGRQYQHQETNDIGHHEFDYALAGHTGDWRRGRIPQRAARFNQPLRAFQTTPHPGPGGREFSLCANSSQQVGVRALKKAEDTDEWIVRVQELHGRMARNVTVSFAGPVLSVREVNAAEEPVGSYHARDGKLVMNLRPYQPRSFAVTLAAAPQGVAPIAAEPLIIPFDLDGVSLHSNLKDGAFGDTGETYPAEMWRGTLTAEGIRFLLGSSAEGARNWLTCRVQTLAVPAGVFNRLYFLAASTNGDQEGAFIVHRNGERTVEYLIRVQDWSLLIGQWDSRLTSNVTADGGPQIVKEIRDGKVVGIQNMKPAYVKRHNIAWVGTHRHNPDGDEAYLFCYFFKFGVDLPTGALSVTLPNNPNIRVAAMTAASTGLDNTRPAGVLFEPELTDAT
ncbi:MAG: glycosyl hydrolase-related protein, partial [Chloroflexi bacterium]|nr:glycosyl hydrolase-related protein [Chloroflexota bacterium]